MNHNHYIVIMAGGVGSRFWPASTEKKPKQFLDILGIGKSLIRMTFERSIRLVPEKNILILTNERYKELVISQLPELPVTNILCEPSMNNTAPSIAYAALRLKALNPNSVFAVLPSDHVILKEDLYIHIMRQSFEFAEKNEILVTLGIQPTRPDTGYGYIKFELNENPGAGDIQPFKKVASFKEKPDENTAKKYLASGDYLWNAGMFIWSLKSILSAFELYAEDILKVLNTDSEVYGTVSEQEFINKVYPGTRIISIDFAIMENAENVYTIPADIGWSDLGTWNSLHAYLADDSNQVVIGSNVHLIECDHIIVRSDNPKTIVIKGLHDYIVVDEEDALLIYPKRDEQEIKQIVSSVLTNNS
ncbi:MAG: NTP transferase domain-containing protein [Saprospiraceae bacterium]|nr:NTP transferase domain-containing protein [Saprospiraceae bacterium]